MIHFYWMPFYFLLGIISLFMSYYLFFAIVYLLGRERILPHLAPQKKFIIIIPAHNEEQLIDRTLEQLLAVNYPRHLFQVVVIADNCRDQTAALAAKHGVLVMERQDLKDHGKGFALSWAFRRLSPFEYDAVVIIDADTIMDRQYLQEMNSALCTGRHVLQSYNNLLNPDDSYLTRLVHVTSVMKNLLLNEGKTRLGLSVALMGTGMCFERKVLEEMGWGAHSIGEDWEYFAKLTQRDVVVNFLARAMTYSQEATSLRQGFSQRLRWAGGKFEMMTHYGFPILWQSLRQSDFWKIDAALSLIAPPFSQLAYLNVLAVGLAFVAYPLEGLGQEVRILSIGLLGSQIIYFALGLLAMKASPKTILSVVASPAFLCWKVVVDVLALVGYRRSVWVRTGRNVQDRKPNSNKDTARLIDRN